MRVKNKWIYSSTSHYIRGADNSLARPGMKQANVSVRMAFDIYRGADKSVARTRRTQVNVCQNDF